MARRPAARGSVAVLGEMLELGAHADAAARRMRDAPRPRPALDLLIAVGGAAARALADAAIAAGMPPATVTLRRDAATRRRALALARIRPGDLVLVKGSRGIGTDLVVDRLKAEFA